MEKLLSFHYFWCFPVYLPISKQHQPPGHVKWSKISTAHLVKVAEIGGLECQLTDFLKIALFVKKLIFLISFICNSRVIQKYD